ncbi:MAG: prolipoprotein diacylglyceryl transferase [Candidatus Brocadiia bacterium]
MQPTLGLPFIHSYGLMLAVGFYAAWWLAARRARAEGVDPEVVSNLVLLAILGGVAGARGLHVALFYESGRPWWWVFEVWRGGLVFYGGLAGAALAVVAYLRWRGESLGRMFDIGAPAVALGQAFGRVGCFLNGCCFGGVATDGFPLGVRFPAFRDAGGHVVGSPAFVQHLERGWVSPMAEASLPIHPTQLYTSASLFAVTALLVAATPWRRRHGELFALACGLIGLQRFAIELVRRDTPPLALGLNAGQWGACGAVAFGLALWVWVRRRGRPVAG